jgi:GTP-binding protein
LCPPVGGPTPLEAYHTIRRELEQYSAALAQREEIVVGNKLDLTEAGDALAELRAALDVPVHGISGVSGQGLRELAELMWSRVQDIRQLERQEPKLRIDLGDQPPLPGDSGAQPGTMTGSAAADELPPAPPEQDREGDRS